MAFFRFLAGLVADRRGITALEYALMAGALATVVALGMTQIGQGVAASWAVVANAYQQANAGR